jgi:hypothetical protein
MAEKTKIGIYDQVNFNLTQSWNIPNKKTKEGEVDDIEILYMSVSKDEDKVGLVLGRNLIKEEQEITEIVIYKKNNKNRFELEKVRDFEFKDACIQFSFNKTNSSELIFFTMTEVFKFDYLDESKDRVTMYELENKLEDQPRFGIFNSD